MELTCDFDDTCYTSDSYSIFSGSMWEDSLVKSGNVYVMSHNPSKWNIDDQLKTISKEKGKEYIGH